MFDMKNDDMDELFRKAAEKYEVDTSKASNWDALSKALQNTETSTMEPEEKKKKKRRLFFWWLVLIPAVLVAYNAWERLNSNPDINATAKADQLKTPAQEGFPNTNSGNTQKTQNSSAFNRNNGNGDEKIAANNDEKNIEDNTAEKKSSETFRENEFATKKNISISKEDANNQAKGDENSYKAISSINNNPKNKKHNKPEPDDKKSKIKNNQTDLFVVDKLNGGDRMTEANKNEGAGISTSYDDHYKGVTGSLQYVSVEQNGKVLPVMFFDSSATGKVQEIQPIVSYKQSDSSLQMKENKPAPHYFYLAAVVSPDLSSVKFQRLSGTGSSIGLLLGYRLNKRWHIETGVMWEKKVYYTKGEYFDKSKLSDYYRNVDMISVDGSCHMFTIPVNVRYNIHAGKKSNWFVATGMSSYLMNKEYYSYTYRHYGGGQPMTKGYDYKSSEKDWMSVINLNVGYERTFLRSFNLRVEPYFRVPVAGVGTGKLSITSGGIYIGIGKRF